MPSFGASVRPVRYAELVDADEMFVVGTAAEVTPVDELDERVFADQRVGRELARLYQRVVRGQETRHAHWLTRV